MIKYIEKTAGMSKVEQLEINLLNNIMTDEAVRTIEEDDPEWYKEYSESKMLDFTEVLSVSKVKAIFYKVETENGNRYFVDSHEEWEGIYKFEEVSESHFDNID